MPIKWWRLVCLIFGLSLLGLSLMTTVSHAEYIVMQQNDIVFAEHDGIKLLGDLYLPRDVKNPPVLIAVHGGGWQLGTRKLYAN
jgi:acetyl esterase/lipase